MSATEDPNLSPFWIERCSRLNEGCAGVDAHVADAAHSARQSQFMHPVAVEIAQTCAHRAKARPWYPLLVTVWIGAWASALPASPSTVDSRQMLPFDSMRATSSGLRLDDHSTMHAIAGVRAARTPLAAAGGGLRVGRLRACGERGCVHDGMLD
jgi:hypothetical protein